MLANEAEGPGELIMVINFANRIGRALTTGLAIGALALGSCLAAMPASAQQDQQQPQDQQQQQGQMNPPQDQGAPRPDQAPPPPDDRGGPIPPADQRRDAQQPAPPDNNYVVPDTFTVSAGAVLQARTTGWLSSDGNKPGDTVIMTLAQPLVVDGFVVARRGQTLIGHVAAAEKAGRAKKTPSKLAVSLNQLTLVDGQLFDLQTSLISVTNKTPTGQYALGVVTTTGVGAGIGAAVGGGPGAAIGAGVGLIAGSIGVLATPGRPTIIPPESLMTFRLEAPITASTVHGQTAFRPVSSREYAPSGRPRPRAGVRPYPYAYRPPPPYGYYPYGYPYPDGYYP